MMIRKSTASWALFVFVSTSTSIVFAQAELEHGVTWTARSGIAGTAVTDVGVGSAVHALNGITVGESFNVPCWLSIYKSEINGSGDSIYANWDQCTYTSTQHAGFLNDSGLHVYGLKVCTNSADDRLKGLFLFGGVVVPDGTFLPLGVPAVFVRPNCNNNWHAPVFCPEGQVASRVRIHHTGGDTITGLSLGCRAVTQQ